MYFSKMILADIINYATFKGVDRSILCKQIGIESLEGIEQGQYTDYETVEKAFTIASQAINDDHIGLHLGEQFTLHATSQVDQIMKSSHTLQEAFENAVVYGKTISDAFLCELEKDEDQVRVNFSINPNFAVYPQFVVQQSLDLTMVCTMYSIYWLTGKKHFPRKINLPFPKPRNTREYLRVFNCSISFNQQVPSIEFDPSLFGQTLSTHDKGLLQELKNTADQLIAEIEPEPLPILHTKHSILKHLPQRISVEQAASEQHFSSRTFQRKLKSLNTSFKAIEKAILLKIACKLMAESPYDMSEMSYLLGFSESSAFIRFFKAEMKMSPKKFKKVHLQYQNSQSKPIRKTTQKP